MAMSPLEKGLARIRVEAAKGQNGLGLLEDRCLDLSAEFSSRTHRAKIYAAIANIYMQADREEYAPEILAYSKKALELPLGPLEAVSMYGLWAKSLWRQHKTAKGRQFAMVRPQIAMPMLLGLKVILEKLEVTEIEPLPSVGLVTGMGDSAYSKRMEQEHAMRLAVRRRAEVQNGLFRQRCFLAASIVDLYTTKPYDTEELRRVAMATLKDVAAVKEIADDVGARIDGEEGVQWLERALPRHYVRELRKRRERRDAQAKRHAPPK